mmetsp:Transcript_29531/g.44735  ORF Transcript_29531/g.44735 Transcript_29531/m.44735 type:complete len:413 (-) Transcript_29531:135-1373(-)
MPFNSSIIVLVILLAASSADAHGYLKSPRARNVVAKEDGANWASTAAERQVLYPKEYCPHCLNLQAPCGKFGNQDYSRPLSMAKTPVPRYPQLILNEGDTQLTVEVVLTAHHKGHFEFKACPYKEKGEKIAQSCFDDYPLLVVSDDFYGMSPDPDFPERAYIPSLSQWNLQSEGSGGSLYRYTLQLPKDLPSGNILLQWHYLTANTCIYSGYDSYAFPSDWGNMGYKGKPYCQMPLSLDGLGLPEQFWNCAEIYMEGNNDEGGDDVDNSSSDSIDENNNSQVISYCGNGRINDGICPNDQDCCSPYGYCGRSSQHCVTSGNPVLQAPSTNNYCGGGYIRTGKCRNPNHCCSPYGYCGSTAAYCQSSPNYYPSWSNRLRRGFHNHNNETSTSHHSNLRRQKEQTVENETNDGS